MSYRSEFRIWQDEINGNSPWIERIPLKSILLVTIAIACAALWVIGGGA